MSNPLTDIKRLNEDATAQQAADWLDEHLPDGLDIRYGTENGATYFRIGDGRQHWSRFPAYAAYDAYVGYMRQ